MKLVIIESPFQGNIDRNINYAFACVRDSVLRGESPYASHLMLPGALNEEDINERSLGIQCGYAWWRAASTIAFYTDLGWSQGMLLAYSRARTQNITIEERSIADHQNRVYTAGEAVKE